MNPANNQNFIPTQPPAAPNLNLDTLPTNERELNHFIADASIHSLKFVQWQWMLGHVEQPKPAMPDEVRAVLENPAYAEVWNSLFRVHGIQTLGKAAAQMQAAKGQVDFVLDVTEGLKGL